MFTSMFNLGPFVHTQNEKRLPVKQVPPCRKNILFALLAQMRPRFSVLILISAKIYRMLQHRKPPHEHIDVSLKWNQKWQKRETSTFCYTTLACVDLTFEVPSSFLKCRCFLLLHFVVYLFCLFGLAWVNLVFYTVNCG